MLAPDLEGTGVTSNVLTPKGAPPPTWAPARGRCDRRSDPARGHAAPYIWIASDEASYAIRDYTKAKLEPQTRAMLDFAAKLTRTPADMSQADVQRLRNHGLSDEQILSTVLITCTFNFMTRLADSLGVEPPEGRQESHSQWLSEAAKAQEWLMTPRA